MAACNTQMLNFALTYLQVYGMHALVARSMTSHVSCCRHFSYLQLAEIAFAVCTILCLCICHKAAARTCKCTRFYSSRYLCYFFFFCIFELKITQCKLLSFTRARPKDVRLVEIANSIASAESFLRRQRQRQ